MNSFFKIIVFLLLAGNTSFAGDYSYIFIQGDKQTPFYVKLEGQMMPRLGKNYCILPNLDEGTIHLEILFQQNIYPPQKFTVKVPAAAGRGFALQQLNDQQFALYDLQTQHHLVAGNSEEDDHLGAAIAEEDQQALAWGNTTAEDVKAKEPELPEFNNKKQPSKKKQVKKNESEEGRFINDIELNRDAVPDFDARAAAVAYKTDPVVSPGENVPEEDIKPSGKKSKAKPPAIIEEDKDMYEGSTVFTEETGTLNGKSGTVEETGNTEAGIPNSDCPSAMNNESFEDFAIRLMEKNDDDAQLKYLRKTIAKNCYTTEQVRILAKNMETQSARFETVKLLYPRVVDQSNYNVLESLFNTSYLKGKFREVISN